MSSTLSLKRLRHEEDIEVREKACWKCKGKGKKFTKSSHKFDGDDCGVCQGSGKRQESNKSQTLSRQPGKIIKLRGLPEDSDNPGGFVGVRAKGSVQDVQLNDGEILASLGCGDWRIFQLANGHKLTVDDFICAYVAAQEMKTIMGFEGIPFGSSFSNKESDSIKNKTTFRHVDIGCGCGSVLMTLAWAFPDSILSHGIEAQTVSYDLCRRGLEFNLGKYHSVDLKNQDFRQSETSNKFDLVTGTPPYFSIERFVPSQNHSQKVRCRVPTRGAAADYVETAARLLTSKGIFVMVEKSSKEAEFAVRQAADNAGLRVQKRIDIVTRTGLPPRFSCWVMMMMSKVVLDDDGSEKEEFPISNFTLRDENQKRTMEYVNAMEAMGWIDFENTKTKKQQQ